MKYADYSKPAPIIRISGRKEENKLILKVEDNGIGISEENLKRVFGLFFTEGSRAKGSGLGLYIVHEAVERLGGSIEIQSEKGRGSTFSLIIPDLKLTEKPTE